MSVTDIEGSLFLRPGNVVRGRSDCRADNNRRPEDSDREITIVGRERGLVGTEERGPGGLDHFLLALVH